MGIGKAGNPSTMDGVHEHMCIGSTTEVLAGEGKIVTAGAIDTHVHFICPQLCDEVCLMLAGCGLFDLLGDCFWYHYCDR